MGAQPPPPPSPRSTADEQALRDKIRSKMQVTTFLAGFTLNAVMMLLRGDAAATTTIDVMGMSISTHALRGAAITCFFAALLLFVSAAYIYDRLATPPAYFSAPSPAARGARSRESTFDRDSRRFGVVYAHMVHTWRFVFSPAVALSVVGFFAVLVMQSTWEIVCWCGGVLLVVLGYYRALRPELSQD